MSRTIQDIFNINDHRTFRAAALEVFYYQSRHTPVYREYLAALRVDPSSVNELEQIPFLPIEFFKSHSVIVEWKNAEVVFESSGTVGNTPSFHHVADASLYHKSFTTAFQLFYGDPDKYCILALLPAYLERSGSSLVHMMDHLITDSGHPDSGFYLNNLNELASLLQKRNEDQQPTLLVGVSFALLDLAEQHPMPLKDHIMVMETGGMKGQRKEMVRGELHEQLKTAFGHIAIHSEYGMTELLSQAYSKGDGLFHCPPWMKILVRDPNDPLELLAAGQSGGINVIDLANLNSCSFIATGDLGKVFEDGSFEVLGRFDHSDIRGCNLLVS
ncbi:MAG: acyl transferase [Bacteroidia bacterium]|nr:MAG: acyl transferase [Bacteroidia bacterium]